MRTTLVNQMISRVMTISVVMTGSQTVWVPWTLLAVPVSLSLKIRVVTRHRDYQNYSEERALAGWLSWLEHVPVHQKVSGLISNLGTYLCCGFNPLLGVQYQPIDIFVSHRCFSPFFPLLKISKHIPR